jgi:alpha-L-fucosidase
MNYIQAFKQAKYGLMLHFGLYSLLGGYYRGNKGPNYAEWIQCHQRISVHEMRRLASVFNPIYFDADEICTFAKRCGMQYIVITA